MNENLSAFILNKLHHEVSNLISGTDWERVARASALLNNFSPRNAILISLQSQSRGTNISKLAGYRNWQTIGRQVSKGQLGYKILAPMFAPKSDESQFRANETSSPKSQPRVIGYRWVQVFDVTQTTGEHIDAPTPQLLEDSSDHQKEVSKRLEVVARNHGFVVSFALIENANGVTDFSNSTITIDTKLKPAQCAKTLAHEIAHVILHSNGVIARDVAEIEAETTAYLVMSSLAIESAQYSFPYIANWSKGNFETVLGVGERALSASGEILEALTASS